MFRAAQIVLILNTEYAAEVWCFLWSICAWVNGWVNNGEAGDLRRHRTHYDVIVMIALIDLGEKTPLQGHNNEFDSIIDGRERKASHFASTFSKNAKSN